MRKWLCIFIGAVISLGYVSSAKADKAFLKALQDTLAKLGNPWIAGETELSDLPLEEKRKMCGFLPMPEREWNPDLEEIKRPPLKKAFLATWDWRDKDGENWMTPVKSQWPCETCWAFAMCSAMESVIKIQNNTPDSNVNLSEQFLTSCNTKGFGCMGGGNFTVFDDVKNFGVCDEACFPYVGNTSCDNRCLDWEDRVVNIESYRENWYIDASDDQMKEWIMEGPIAVAVNAKEDFFYYKGGAYEPILGEEKFDHAVCCLGWTSSGNWICKNSYGYTAPWPIFSVIGCPCWVKMESTGTPIIWTSDSLNFVFGGKGVFSSNPSIPFSDSDKTSSSANLESILLSGEHILKPSQIKNISESSKGEDTLQYDNLADGWQPWQGINYFGVRFTSLFQQCKVIAGLVGRYTDTQAKNDRLIVRDDAGGNPGTTIEEVPYTTQIGDSIIWYRQDLSTPYFDGDDFWLTYYAETDETSSYFIGDMAGGDRSYYSADRSDWHNMSPHNSDLLIRAIVIYEGGYAGSGIIWVKNIGEGTLEVSNVNAAGSSNWIAFITPTNFNVYMGDSACIKVAIDTSGLQEDTLYTDEIVITSNSGKAENRVPISLFIKSHGVAEEKKPALATLKLSPNPFRDKVGISYFVPEKTNVKLVVCDIAGREIAKIVDRLENIGIKKIEWDTKDIPSGVYFCRLAIENSETTRKVLLVR